MNRDMYMSKKEQDLQYICLLGYYMDVHRTILHEGSFCGNTAVPF
jgi:hypothetical protein